MPAGNKVYDLGVTGADWPGAKARPAAWRLRLLAADGSTLIAKKFPLGAAGKTVNSESEFTVHGYGTG